MTRRAVFLDRDGVLNRAFVRAGVPYPPASVAAVEILPGVRVALDLLAASHFALIVVTNQPDVARGTQTRGEVERINTHLQACLPLDAVYTCYHDTPDGCACRKPKPGLLLQAAGEHDLALDESFMVGDRWSDVAAGAAAGCTTLLIDTSYNQRERCVPDALVADLGEAARQITARLTIGGSPATGAGGIRWGQSRHSV